MWTSAISAGLKARMGRGDFQEGERRKEELPEGRMERGASSKQNPQTWGHRRGEEGPQAMSSKLTHFDFIGQKMGVTELPLEQGSGLISCSLCFQVTTTVICKQQKLDSGSTT